MTTNRKLQDMLELAMQFVSADDGTMGCAGAKPGLAAGCGPVVTLEHFKSAPWASATFEGFRHEFSLSVSGAEDEVDRMAARLEADMVRGEFALADLVLADVARVNTDKTLSGDGDARSLLHFEALTVRD